MREPRNSTVLHIGHGFYLEQWWERDGTFHAFWTPCPPPPEVMRKLARVYLAIRHAFMIRTLEKSVGRASRLPLAPPIVITPTQRGEK